MDVSNRQAYRVVIVGGGAAGWMTAAYLIKAFGSGLRVSLIESGQIGTIGVGEATFSDIHLFFSFLGLRENEWMKDSNATYKLAIKFESWTTTGRSFYHPFQRFELADGHSMAEWWLRLRPSSMFDRDCFTSTVLCDSLKSPKDLDERVFAPVPNDYVDGGSPSSRPVLMEELTFQHPYAYHFDAALFAKVLSNYAQLRGVVRIVDDVVEVVQSEGGITAVRTREHGRVEGDLFIDCTGFRGLLINQALGEPFVSFSESLPCDRAVAMQVPSDASTTGIKPYTTARALSAGWVWEIPLYHRIGAGYVYSSACLSPEEAETEFRENIGPASSGCNAIHIKMRVGRNRNSWVKNCVAIGLSSGFVEPLESTGIFFIQNSIEQLMTHFPRKTQCNDPLAKSYNQVVGACIDGVREFLTFHYCASSRRDTPFWKLTQNELVVPEALKERLALWKTRLPTKRTIRSEYHGFAAHNYCSMLLGLGWYPDSCPPFIEHQTEDTGTSRFADIRARRATLHDAMPSHYSYLAAKYG
jgi:flavin-dependent dehydrogenase